MAAPSGISVSHTGRIRDGETYRQTDIFDRTDYEKLERMDRTVDQIRGQIWN